MSTTISVVIPVYNNSEYIVRTIESVLSQSHKPDEIIVIDNNSTDGTIEIVKQYPVMLLQEKDVQSSYAARNKGIDHARSEIIAFIDADCTAADNWLKEGVTALQSESADLAGGRVEFFFSEKKTTAELYDSIHHLNIEASIRDTNSAPTANLFVKTHVFKKTGVFSNYLKSGGDIQWTKRATDNGFSLIYAPKAVVKHPTRKLKDLLKKSFRIGTGRAHLRRSRGFTLWHEVPYSIYNALVIGIPLSAVRKNYDQSSMPEIKGKFLRILFVAYLCRILSRFGMFIETLNILKGKIS